MTKYIVHRTYTAVVTDIYEMEVRDDEDPYEVFYTGGATFVKSKIDDSVLPGESEEEFFEVETEG